jgi:hypothetical protein
MTTVCFLLTISAAWAVRRVSGKGGKDLIFTAGITTWALDDGTGYSEGLSFFDLHLHGVFWVTFAFYRPFGLSCSNPAAEEREDG